MGQSHEMDFQTRLNDSEGEKANGLAENIVNGLSTWPNKSVQTTKFYAISFVIVGITLHQVGGAMAHIHATSFLALWKNSLLSLMPRV